MTRPRPITRSALTHRVRELRRGGITWTFDRPVPAGRFAGGDWWVVGPVTVTGVRPEARLGRNGSMVDPPVTDLQAYDDRAYNYDERLAAHPPIRLQPGQSLVSTGSDEQPSPSCLLRAAVLTCLPQPPPPGCLRPPYVAGDKPLFSVHRLRLDRIAPVEPVPGAPHVDDIEAELTGLWLDHQPTWHGRFIHPTLNMPDYGREIATMLGDAALLLCTSVPGRHRLAVRLVQIGIDLAGIAAAGGGWPADGGHASGRKLPILLAGWLLGESWCFAAARRATFGEDEQTFYLTQADVDRGVGYRPDQVGQPEWGIRHATHPEQDRPDWDAPYRRCCTACAWVGQVLAARLLGLEPAWGHRALFEYQDRYMATEPPGAYRAWSHFAGSMWDRYGCAARAIASTARAAAKRRSSASRKEYNGAGAPGTTA